MLRIILFLVLLITTGCNSERSSPNNDLQGNQTVEPQEQTSSETELRSQYSTENSEGGLWGSVIVTIGIVYVIAIHAFLIILYFKYKNIIFENYGLNNRIEHEMRKINELDIELKKEKNNNSSFIKKINDLKRQNIELKTLRKESNAEQKSLDSPSVVNLRERAKSMDKGIPSNIYDNPNFKIHYFSIPNENGTFALKRGDESSEGRKYYKVRFKEGGGIGKVNYIPGPLDKSAIDQMDSILKPVCYIINSEISNPTSIKGIQEGTVKLRGDEWVIKDKIQIEFKK